MSFEALKNIFQILAFVKYVFVNIFYHSIALLFVLFTTEKFLILMRSNLSIFSFMDVFFGVKLPFSLEPCTSIYTHLKTFLMKKNNKLKM